MAKLKKAELYYHKSVREEIALVCSEQRGGADLRTEIADPLIPSKKLEYVIQCRAVSSNFRLK